MIPHLGFSLFKSFASVEVDFLLNLKTERHLKKNNYPVSIKDKQFELTRKCLQSKQKELKKAGRGNKDKATVALTDEEIDIICLLFPLLNHC